MRNTVVATGRAVALTTGIEALDQLIDGVRVGDNLVVVASDPNVLDTVGRAFAAATSAAGPLVVAAFERRGDQIAAPARMLDLRDADLRWPAPIELLERADVDVGEGASFLIDSLDSVNQRWGRDAAVELFLTICPRLYLRRSVALWLVDAASCDAAFIERLTSITQVVIQLIGSGSEIEAEVMVAAGRAPSVIGQRLSLSNSRGQIDARGPVHPGRYQLGEAIRTHRLARGTSQAQLARQVGITPSGLSQIERGIRGLTGETLMRIWEVLGVPFGPQDESSKGYRISRRTSREITQLGAGVVGSLLLDDRQVGQCWQVDIDGGASGTRALFEGKSTEVVVVLSGVLEIELQGCVETLHAGDSVVISHALVDAWRNPGPQRCSTIWHLLR